jgi:hypothetical protein
MTVARYGANAVIDMLDLPTYQRELARRFFTAAFEAAVAFTGPEQLLTEVDQAQPNKMADQTTVEIGTHQYRSGERLFLVLGAYYTDDDVEARITLAQGYDFATSTKLLRATGQAGGEVTYGIGDQPWHRVSNRQFTGVLAGYIAEVCDVPRYVASISRTGLPIVPTAEEVVSLMAAFMEVIGHARPDIRPDHLGLTSLGTFAEALLCVLRPEQTQRDENAATQGIFRIWLPAAADGPLQADRVRADLAYRGNGQPVLHIAAASGEVLLQAVGQGAGLFRCGVGRTQWNTISAHSLTAAILDLCQNRLGLPRCRHTTDPEGEQ